MKKILDNKVIKIIGKIIYALLYIIILLTLLVVLIQRFSNNNFTIAGFRIFNVATGSMVPEYNVGDILISKEINPNELQVGDNIVYQGEKQDFKGKIVTHKIIEKREENGKLFFTTKGIANEEADPEISEEQIYGKIVYKTIILSFISAIINNIYVFYFLIFIPISIIICKMIIDNVISYKNTKAEKSELNSGTKEKKDKTVKTVKIEERVDEKEKNTQKKTKKILKYINPKTMIVLILLLVFNAYAWFIYATRASLDLTTHVAAWEISFDAGESQSTTSVILEIDRIYPGMEDYIKEIKVFNRGELLANLSYTVTSIQILGDSYEIGENYTADDLQNILDSYPFKITVETSTDQIAAETGEGKFIIKVVWPFESGNDEADTYWGNKSAEFQKNNPQEKGLRVSFELTATQNN
jgi:signal peptidase